MLAALTRRPALAALSLLMLVLIATALIELNIPGLWSKAVSYGIAMQRDLHRDLADAMRAVQRSEGAAFWSLIGLGFLYGVFHAVGPGHGKVVISTYLATHESRLARGISLSLLSSMVQGLTAILVVGGAALLLERSMRDSQHLGIWLEVLSYGLVILIGLFLTWRSLRRLMARRQGEEAAHDHGHDHGHDHAGCCHGHGPCAEDLAAPLSKKQLAAMILSIGIRPCSGAILVLVLAFAMQQLTAGIAAVLAMSFGTGLSISALAALSVYARRGAIALANIVGDEGGVLPGLIDVAAALGGLVIAAFGLALLNAALAVSQHPLL